MRSVLSAGMMLVAFLAWSDAVAAQELEVGLISKLVGSASATHPDGTSVGLAVDGAVRQGDTVTTGPDSAVVIRFVDGTTLSMAANATMTIDELVYDPGSESNSALLDLTDGLFVLVSGDVAQSGDMTVTTPVSTIGIRGTAVAIQSARTGLTNTITLLRDPNGNDGIVEVANGLETVILDTLGDTAELLSGDAEIATLSLSAQDIANIYQAALQIIQALTGSDLGVPAEPEEEVTEEDALELLQLIQDLINENQENPAQDDASSN